MTMHVQSFPAFVDFGDGREPQPAAVTVEDIILALEGGAVLLLLRPEVGPGHHARWPPCGPTELARRVALLAWPPP